MRGSDMHRTEEERSARLVTVMLDLLAGGVAGLVVCLVFLFAASAAIAANLLGEEMMYRLCVAGGCLGGLLGGLVAIDRQGARTLVMGVLTGVVLYLLLLLAGAVFYAGSPLEEGRIGILCAILCGGVLAGLLGVRKPKRRKKR